ncbi:hypothetical protein BH20VER1_BH20VER1_23700 [soil metagenome]
MQTVRTTAYTHSESDHLIYGRRNALGGTLSSATVPPAARATRSSRASRPSRRAEEKPRRARPVAAFEEPEGLTIGLMTREKRLALSKKRDNKKDKARGQASRSRKPAPPRIGSAAADWSRWPAGTVFKVLSTGQTYRVDDYGWALAGTNTIDLYMPSKSAMNSWGVRHVPIQVINWGDPQQSLAVLRGRQSYRHVRRMVLALEGNHESAAALR